MRQWHFDSVVGLEGRSEKKEKKKKDWTEKRNGVFINVLLPQQFKGEITKDTEGIK